MIRVRPAHEADVPAIRDLYVEVYGKEYPHQEVFDEHWLKKSIFSDDALILVAEDAESGRLAGTASVLLDFGAHSDLIAEFGRLAVHPDFRRQGIGKLLMAKRLEAIGDRLHVGLVVARSVHPYAQQISLAHHFYPVGFLPFRHQFKHRESFALLARHFGDAIALRKNNPRIIPEVYPLANLVMKLGHLPCDLIVDEESPPYPHGGDYRLEELQVQGFPALLRIERGRTRNREVFGSMRLEYGFFRLRGRHATYFLAKEGDQIVGAIGFTQDPMEPSVQVFELITLHDSAIRFLLSELERRCREERGVDYIEVDVSAHAPRMQRTLLELNFLPAAYIPAMVFYEVERLDIVKMVRLGRLRKLGTLGLTPPMKEVEEVVMRGFTSRMVTPRLAKVVADIPLFQGFTDEQATRLAGACSVKEFGTGEQVFREKEEADRMYIVLDGKINVSFGTPAVGIGTVGKGETLGELSLLSGSPHSATATAETSVEAAVLTHKQLGKLVRQRPDIGVIMYRNLAAGLGTKLLRSDSSLRQQFLGEAQLLNLTLNLSRKEQ